MEIIRTLLILSLLVIVHELGHYLVARLFGVRVLEFSVGFGPLLAKTVRREIQYSLRAVPLGGFVKLAGMDTALEGEADHEAEIGPGSIRHQPAWKKSLIVLAGPVNNLIMAAVTFFIMFAAIGVPRDVDARSIIGNVEPKAPAYEAGISAGDRVVAVDGQPIHLWSELSTAIRASQGKPVILRVERAGRIMTRTVKPLYDPGYEVYVIGVIQRPVFQRLGLGDSLLFALRSVYGVSVDIVRMIGLTIKGKARISLSGPVGAIGAVEQSRRAGPWWLLFLLASINLFLGLFNMLPIPLPILDGGWVVIFLLEAIRRREFTDNQKAAAQVFGLVVLFAFFLFVTYGDVVTEIRRFLNR